MGERLGEWLICAPVAATLLALDDEINFFLCRQRRRRSQAPVS
jgi:hypothetical protein